jgi:hypothetical protein
LFELSSIVFYLVQQIIFGGITTSSVFFASGKNKK